MVDADDKPPVSFWVISFALLVWGLGGASIYAAYFIQTPAEFAESAENAANREGYAEYVGNIPPWAIAVGIIAAAARLLGAVGLLLRRAWALHLYVISTIFFAAALYRAFVLASVADVMSAPHIAIEAVFLSLSIFAIGYARWGKAKGLLR